jgi:hypothetical protein
MNNSFTTAEDERQIKQILSARGYQKEEAHETKYFVENAKGGVLSRKSSGQQKGSG